MKRIVSVSVWSVAKFYGVLSAVIGLIAGIIFIDTNILRGTSAGGAGLLTPIMLFVGYAIIGFLGGALGAYIYNVFARELGGIEVELEDIEEEYEYEEDEYTNE